MEVVPSRKTTVTTVICHKRLLVIHLKSCKSMKYNISKSAAPAMPNLGKGTECIKLLLSQASKEMHEPLIPMSIPALASHVTDVKFMYCDNKYYELCGQMGHLIDVSGIGKAQFTNLVEGRGVSAFMFLCGFPCVVRKISVPLRRN